MSLAKTLGVASIAAMTIISASGVAQAFSPINVAGQAGETIQNSINTAIPDTVNSLATDREAHDYLAGNPGGRYIVVLGARINPDGTLPGILNARLDKAASIARAQPGSRVVVSGGATQPLPYNEAQAMMAGLTLRGVNPANVILEDRSYSTVENARNTTAILYGNGVEGAVLVTSASHIDRAMGNFISSAPNLRFVPVSVPGW